MDSEPFHPEAAPDVPTEAAVIRPVTPEQLDEAAHRAAQLADDVAHHAVEAGSDAAEGRQAVLETGAAVASDAAETIGTTVSEAAQDAVARTEHVAAASLDAAGSAVARAAGDLESGSGDPIGRYNAAVIGMIRSNMTATGEHFAALVKAKSVPEAVAINADHLRRQFDTLTTQGRELAQLAQTLALDALKPLTGTVRRDA